MHETAIISDSRVDQPHLPIKPHNFIIMKDPVFSLLDCYKLQKLTKGQSRQQDEQACPLFEKVHVSWTEKFCVVFVLITYLDESFKKLLNLL